MNTNKWQKLERKKNLNLIISVYSGATSSHWWPLNEFNQVNIITGSQERAIDQSNNFPSKAPFFKNWWQTLYPVDPLTGSSLLGIPILHCLYIYIYEYKMRLKHKLHYTHTIYNIQDIEKHITRISPIKFEKLNKFREKHYIP